jgi:invasion protein IalB
MSFSLRSVLAVVSCAFASPLLAQTAVPEPSSTTATYGDWMMRCLRESPESKIVICEAAQALMVEGQANPIAQIAFGRLNLKAPLRLTIVVPVNVAFDKNPQMQIEGQANSAVTLSWRRCAPGGCFADLEIKPEIVTQWRAASKAGQINFRNAANQDVALPFSFRGLAQALEALPKS